jgi:hypothetical protein
MMHRAPFFPRIGQVGPLRGGLLGQSPRLPPIVISRPARLAGVTLVYATPDLTVPVGAINPTSTFELTTGPWPPGWVEIVFERTPSGGTALAERVRGFVQESAFITPPLRDTETVYTCVPATCFLFPVPIAGREVTNADIATSLQVPTGTRMQITSTVTPAGWFEVVPDFPPGSGSRTRRYVRASELGLPDTTPGRPPPVATDPGGVRGDQPGGAGAPAAPSATRQIGQFLLLTSPAWGAVVLSYFLRGRR